MYFPMFRAAYLIEANSFPEKSLCVGQLAAHLFNLILIFLSDGLTDSSGMSGSSCGCILPITGPILQQWTDIGHPD
jgi:hypothetical protein